MLKMICSRCKAESEPVTSKFNRPEGWMFMTIGFAGVAQRMEICKTCADHFNISESKRGSENMNSVKDRLVEVIEEIAMGVMPEE